MTVPLEDHECEPPEPDAWENPQEWTCPICGQVWERAAEDGAWRRRA